MEQFVLDEIIEYLEANPNADAVQVIKDHYLKGTDQIEHAFVTGQLGQCEEGRCSTSDEFLKIHFNIEI